MQRSETAIRTSHAGRLPPATAASARSAKPTTAEDSATLPRQVLCPLKNEGEVFGQVFADTKQLGSKLAPQGDEVAIKLGA